MRISNTLGVVQNYVTALGKEVNDHKQFQPQLSYFINLMEIPKSGSQKLKPKQPELKYF